jgi:hypothetical protein
VRSYLDILEKAFVIKRLGAYSRNLKNEINTKSKYYFWDNGVMNALISQFSSFENRNDIGALFENFIIMEMMKKKSVSINNYYFWRDYSGQEVDLIEEKDGVINAYEFKWSKSKVKKPNNFIDSYKNVNFNVVNKDNYLDLLLL